MSSATGVEPMAFYTAFGVAVTELPIINVDKGYWKSFAKKIACSSIPFFPQTWHQYGASGKTQNDPFCAVAMATILLSSLFNVRLTFSFFLLTRDRLLAMS